MRELKCMRCGAPYPNPVALGEHQLGCRGAMPPPEPKRANPGKKLEDRVKDSARSLGHVGLALRQTSPRTSGRHGPGGTFVGRTMGKGGLDFEGDFKGRAVLVDAKSCARPSFPLANLHGHQVDRVRNAHARGAIAFFLVEMVAAPRGPRYFALTWPALEPYLMPDAPRSIPLDVLAARCPEVGRHGRLLDLVAAIQAVGAVVGGAA